MAADILDDDDQWLYGEEESEAIVHYSKKELTIFSSLHSGQEPHSSQTGDGATTHHREWDRKVMLQI